MSYGIRSRAHFQVLDRHSLERIHWATLRVLEKVGVQVMSQYCLQLLKGSGCEIDERRRTARVPSHLVEDALRKKGGAITLAARHRKLDVKLDMSHSYMCSSGNGAVTVDFDTGKRRSSTKEDVCRSSRICDAAKNIHVHWPMVSSTDKPPQSIHLHDLDASLNNTEKHVMHETAVTVQDAENLVEIGYAAAGGEKEFRRRPICSALECTFAPLQIDGGIIDAGIVFAGAGVPLVYFCMPQPGATGPGSLAGSVVVGNAEVLSALTITQLAVPGSQIVYGMGIAPLDMRTATRAAGSPEHGLCSAIGTELAHFYNMPSCVGLACTANSPGDQACLEIFTGVLPPLMAKADMICGIGLLEDGSCLHLEEVVIEDEIVEVAARMCGEQLVDDEMLALDEIEQVGAGRSYLSQRHTLKHASSAFKPKLMDRLSNDAWVANGSKSVHERARERVRWLLENHEVPPLPGEAQKEVDAIIARAERFGRNI